MKGVSFHKKSWMDGLGSYSSLMQFQLLSHFQLVFLLRTPPFSNCYNGTFPVCLSLVTSVMKSAMASK
jgi:hypothetical protein